VARGIYPRVLRKGHNSFPSSSSYCPAAQQDQWTSFFTQARPRQILRRAPAPITNGRFPPNDRRGLRPEFFAAIQGLIRSLNQTVKFWDARQHNSKPMLKLIRTSTITEPPFTGQKMEWRGRQWIGAGARQSGLPQEGVFPAEEEKSSPHSARTSIPACVLAEKSASAPEPDRRRNGRGVV